MFMGSILIMDLILIDKELCYNPTYLNLKLFKLMLKFIIIFCSIITSWIEEVILDIYYFLLKLKIILCTVFSFKNVESEFSLL